MCVWIVCGHTVPIITSHWAAHRPKHFNNKLYMSPQTFCPKNPIRPRSTGCHSWCAMQNNRTMLRFWRPEKVTLRPNTGLDTSGDEHFFAVYTADLIFRHFMENNCLDGVCSEIGIATEFTYMFEALSTVIALSHDSKGTANRKVP